MVDRRTERERVVDGTERESGGQKDRERVWWTEGQSVVDRRTERERWTEGQREREVDSRTDSVVDSRTEREWWASGQRSCGMEVSGTGVQI